MNASRMRRPSAVRTGMFCRLGSVDASRPVTAVACENVVCTPPGARVDHRAAACRCTWTSASPARDTRASASAADSRPRAPAARPRRSTAGRSASSCLTGSFIRSNRISHSCFGEPRLNGRAGELVRLLLERVHALAQLAALRGEQRRVDEHAGALHAEQHVAHRQLDRRRRCARASRRARSAAQRCDAAAA